MFATASAQAFALSDLSASNELVGGTLELVT